jgi:hypothetical protein
MNKTVLIYALVSLVAIIFLPQKVKCNEISDKEITRVFTSLADLTEQAKNGDPQAQGFLAQKHFLGDGLEQDYEKAFYWFKKAAKQDNASAQHNLGVMYNQGLYVEKNLEAAIKYVSLACENGLVDGCRSAVSLLDPSDEKALYFHKKGCALGYQASCGMVKVKEKKYDEATSILEAACQNGDELSCKILKTVLKTKGKKAELDVGVDNAFSLILKINLVLFGVILTIVTIVKIFTRNKKTEIDFDNHDKETS